MTEEPPLKRTKREPKNLDEWGADLNKFLAPSDLCMRIFQNDHQKPKNLYEWAADLDQFLVHSDLCMRIFQNDCPDLLRVLAEASAGDLDDIWMRHTREERFWNILVYAPNGLKLAVQHGAHRCLKIILDHCRDAKDAIVSPGIPVLALALNGLQSECVEVLVEAQASLAINEDEVDTDMEMLEYVMTTNGPPSKKVACCRALLRHPDLDEVFGRAFGRALWLGLCSVGCSVSNLERWIEFATLLVNSAEFQQAPTVVRDSLPVTRLLWNNISERWWPLLRIFLFAGAWPSATAYMFEDGPGDVKGTADYVWAQSPARAFATSFPIPDKELRFMTTALNVFFQPPGVVALIHSYAQCPVGFLVHSLVATATFHQGRRRKMLNQEMLEFR